MKPGNLELFATTMVKKKKKKSMRRNPTKRNEEKLGPSLRISFKAHLTSDLFLYFLGK